MKIYLKTTKRSLPVVQLNNVALIILLKVGMQS